MSSASSAPSAAAPSAGAPPVPSASLEPKVAESGKTAARDDPFDPPSDEETGDPCEGFYGMNHRHEGDLLVRPPQRDPTHNFAMIDLKGVQVRTLARVPWRLGVRPDCRTPHPEPAARRRFSTLRSADLSGYVT